MSFFNIMLTLFLFLISLIGGVFIGFAWLLFQMPTQDSAFVRSGFALLSLMPVVNYLKSSPPSLQMEDWQDPTNCTSCTMAFVAVILAITFLGNASSYPINCLLNTEHTGKVKASCYSTCSSC